MITMVALARRVSSMSQSEFAHRWVVEHAPGTRYPGLISYSIGVAPPDAAGNPYDGVALMTFTSLSAMDAAAASEAGQRNREDADSFCATLDFFVVEMHEIPIATT